MKGKFFVICLLWSVMAVAQTPGFKISGNVQEDVELAAQMREMLKQHKKQYKYSSAKIEKWVDGNTYIVAKKGQDYTIFNIDGTPLLSKNGELKYFGGILPEKIHGYDFFTLYPYLSDSSYKGIANKRALFCTPDESRSVTFDIMNLSGTDFLVGKPKVGNWPNSCAVYSLDGVKLMGHNESATDAAYSPACGGRFFLSKFTRNPQGRLDNFTFFKNLRGEVIDSIHGFFGTAIDSLVVISGARLRVDTISDNEKTIVDISIGRPSKLVTLASMDGKILLDSLSSIRYYVEPQKVVYRKSVIDKVSNSEALNTGLFDPADANGCIEPLFAEINLKKEGDTWNPYVTLSLFSDEEKFVSGKPYQRTYSCEAEELLSRSLPGDLLNAYKDRDFSTLSDVELICVARGVLRLYELYNYKQDALLDYYSKVNIIDDNEKAFRKMMEREATFNMSQPISMMDQCLELLSISNNADVVALTSALGSENDILLGNIIYTRDTLLPEKRDAYIEMSTQFTNKIEDSNRRYEAFLREQEEKERQRKQEIIASWAASARQWADAYRAAQAAKESSRRMAARGTSAANVSAGGGASYEQGDNTNRKIFLREKIAEWKLKLKRAEESYERQMSSGDDSREKRRALESAHNRVMECADMIRQFESELNSLK